jgi:RNA polymerase sigma-70 factor, ECF subfamily
VESRDQFESLFESDYVPLVRVAFVIVGDEGIAREVVQEAFARALVRWRRLSRYDKPGAWVRLVTVRLAMRAQARRHREVSHVVDELHDRGRLDRPADHDVLTALAALPAQYRAVIVLHYLCDLPVAEVARLVRARPGTVRVQLHRGRQRLAEVLGQEVLDVES